MLPTHSSSATAGRTTWTGSTWATTHYRASNACGLASNWSAHPNSHRRARAIAPADGNGAAINTYTSPHTNSIHAHADSRTVGVAAIVRSIPIGQTWPIVTPVVRCVPIRLRGVRITKSTVPTCLSGRRSAYEGQSRKSSNSESFHLGYSIRGADGLTHARVLRSRAWQRRSKVQPVNHR
jgi:hypothetical protein